MVQYLSLGDDDYSNAIAVHLGVDVGGTGFQQMKIKDKPPTPRSPTPPMSPDIPFPPDYRTTTVPTSNIDSSIRESDWGSIIEGSFSLSPPPGPPPPGAARAAYTPASSPYSR